MKYGLSKKQRTIIIGISIGFIVIVMILVGFLTRDTGKNQFGDRIRIQNYSSVVKNLSSDMRDSMETYLYNVVKLNYEGDLNGASVQDPYIRDDSASQTRQSQQNTYDGYFIIDIKSLKQSYQTQYSYSDSSEEATISTSSSPVVISCLPVEKLIYGEFNCLDLVSEHSSPNDIILQYLPYKSLSFTITPNKDSSSDTLELEVHLTIPDIDLSGDTASKQQVVAMYKQEVLTWIQSKEVDPNNYTIHYNYDDNGVVIETHLHEDDSSD